jgi:hypothetical protein
MPTHVEEQPMRRIHHLRELVLDAQYVVDEKSVADAIVARAIARRLLPEVVFRNDPRGTRVRSFRPSKQARSFRPCSRDLSRSAVGGRRR